MKDNIIIAIIIFVIGYLYIKFELWFWKEVWNEDEEENTEKKGLEKEKK